MDDKGIAAKREHSGPEEEKDGRAELKAFQIRYVLATPGTARVLARDAGHAVEKLENWEVEECQDDEMASDLEVKEVREVSQ
jgi:hypothetical protein